MSRQLGELPPPLLWEGSRQEDGRAAATAAGGWLAGRLRQPLLL